MRWSETVRANQGADGLEQGQRPQAVSIDRERLVEEGEEPRYQLLDERLEIADRRLVDASLAPGRLNCHQLDTGIEILHPRAEGGGTSARKRKAEQAHGRGRIRSMHDEPAITGGAGGWTREGDWGRRGCVWKEFGD